MNDIRYLLPHKMQFLNDFLNQVAAHARDADARKTTLFIMVFAPVSNDHDICVSFDTSEPVFVTTDMIRSTIQNSVGRAELPVVLMTVSALTAGWLCRPSLFPVSGNLTNKGIVNITAKSCGGVFADVHMDSFVKTSTTPLLTTEERAKMPYEDMMPVGPNAEQTARLHLFQGKIHEVLKQRFSADAMKAGILYDSIADGGMELRPKIGAPLSFSNGVCSSELSDNHPGLEFLGDAFGGTIESQIFHLKYLVNIELRTCYGDWTIGATGITKQLFGEFTTNNSLEMDTVKRVFDALEFRGSSMALTLMLAIAFNLPRPVDKCRSWEGNTQDDSFYAAVHAAQSDIQGLFGRPAVFPGERRHDFNHVRFHRASKWLSTCVAKFFTDRPIGDIKAFVRDELAPFFKLLREAQAQLLNENPAIDAAGTAWLTSLRLGPLERTTLNLHERMKRKLEEMDATDRVIEKFKHGVLEAANSAKRAKTDKEMTETQDIEEATAKPDAAATSDKNPETMLVTDWDLFEKKYSDHAAATTATTTATVRPTDDTNLDPTPDAHADATPQTFESLRPQLEHWKDFNDKPVVSVADYDDQMEALKKSGGAAKVESSNSQDESTKGKTAVNDAGASRDTDSSLHTQVEKVTASIRHLSIGPSTPKPGPTEKLNLEGDPTTINAFKKLAGIVSQNPGKITEMLKNLESQEANSSSTAAETSADKCQDSDETGERMSGEVSIDNAAHLTPPQTPLGLPGTSAHRRQVGATASGRDDVPATTVSDDGHVNDSVGGDENKTQSSGGEGAIGEVATDKPDATESGGDDKRAVCFRLAEPSDFWAKVPW